METCVYDITSEPRGRIYRSLINQALTLCTKFLFVLPGSELGDWGKEVLRDLEPYLHEAKQQSQWPGTVLLGDGADTTVLYYHLTVESAEILKTAVPRLYAWLHPDLPEDLCLFRPDGKPWLVSISHEHDSYLEMTPHEATVLLEELPEFTRLLEERPTEVAEGSIQRPSAEQLVSMLSCALSQRNRMPENISAYLRAVRLSPEVIGEDWSDDIFRELASELEWYEGDPDIRSEDPLLRGESESEEQIRTALARLKHGSFPANR